MRGKMEATFYGGPLDGDIIQMACAHCRAVVAVTGQTVFAGAPGQDVRLMRQAQYPSPHFTQMPTDWRSYNTHVYQKIAPGKGGKVEYQYLRDEMVSRCKKVLGLRYCGNHAPEGDEFCFVHSEKQKKSSRSKAYNTCPSCNGFRLRERKTKKPKWVCVECKHAFDKPKIFRKKQQKTKPKKRCPNCKMASIYHRRSKSPSWRCSSCNHEFDKPLLQ